MSNRHVLFTDRNGEPRRGVSVSLHADDYREIVKIMKDAKRKQLGPFVADIVRQALRARRAARNGKNGA